MASLTVTPRRPGGAFLYGSRIPQLRVSGVGDFCLTWGRNSVELPAGHYVVEAWTSYLLLRGRAAVAATEIELKAGECLSLSYRLPTFAFQRAVLVAVEPVDAAVAESNREAPGNLPFKNLPFMERLTISVVLSSFALGAIISAFDLL